MNSKEIQQLQQVLNRPMIYGNRPITLLAYRLNTLGDRVKIDSSDRPEHFDKMVEALPEFIRQLKPVDANLPAVTNAQAMLGSMTNADELERILMDSIKKLEKEPAYIKQATAINNNVNSIININKMKLDFAKAAMKMN